MSRGKCWIAPRIWDGGECVILGGGPSLALIDVERLRGTRVIACNDAFRLADWIDVLFFGDCPWHQWNSIDIADFGGLKVTRCDRLHGTRGVLGMTYDTRKPGSLSTDPGVLQWNSSTGACAINLAVLFGVKKITLLGYDMRRWSVAQHKKLSEQARDVTRHNWHGHHRKQQLAAAKKAQPKKKADPDTLNPYEKYMEPFVGIAADLKDLGVECVNASPMWNGERVTKLDVFPVVDPEAAFSWGGRP